MTVARLVLRVRLLRLIGLTSFTRALLSLVSARHRTVLGRWSYPAFAVNLGAVLLLCGAAWNSWRAYRATNVRTDSRLSAATLLDGAIALWGAGFLLATLDLPSNAGNIFDLNFFGSTTAPTVVLYWLCLAALFLAVGRGLRWGATARWANAGLSVAAIALLGLLGEGAVRAKALLAPMIQGFPTYTSALWGRRYVRLNREGFRDIEHSLLRVPGTNRVLVIGDSYAFGAGIRRTQDRLGEQLAMRLDSATGTGWEVINAGRPDRNTLNEIATLDSTISYGPDVVILVYVFNDIDYLYPVTERTVLTEAPRNMLQRVHPVRLLFENSFLFQEAYVWVRKIRWSFPQADSRNDPYADPRLVLEHLGDLARFVATAEHAGAVVGIVPFDPQVVDNPVARRRYESFVGRALVAGLPIWRVDSVFNGFTTPQLTVNQLDGHPSELANRLVANAIWPRVLKGAAAAVRAERCATPERPLPGERSSRRRMACSPTPSPSNWCAGSRAERAGMARGKPGEVLLRDCNSGDRATGAGSPC